MHVLYGFTRGGGFACGDLDSGITSYAFPSSFYAERAKLKPGPVAAAMLAGENPSLECRPGYDRSNWAALRAISTFQVVDGIIILPLSAIVES